MNTILVSILLIITSILHAPANDIPVVTGDPQVLAGSYTIIQELTIDDQSSKFAIVVLKPKQEEVKHNLAFTDGSITAASAKSATTVNVTVSTAKKEVYLSYLKADGKEFHKSTIILD